MINLTNFDIKYFAESLTVVFRMYLEHVESRTLDAPGSRRPQPEDSYDDLIPLAILSTVPEEPKEEIV